MNEDGDGRGPTPPTPISRVTDEELLRAIDEVIDFWHVHPDVERALLGDLVGVDPAGCQLSDEQRTRLNNLALVDLNLRCGAIDVGTSPSILILPQASPDRSRPLLQIMADDPGGVRAVADYLGSLPSGPIMLPGVIPGLIDLGLLEPAEYAADIVEAQEWISFPGLEEFYEYAEGIVAQFLAALADTPVDFRTEVWSHLAAANDPALASWATAALALEQSPPWPLALAKPNE